MAKQKQTTKTEAKAEVKADTKTKASREEVVRKSIRESLEMIDSRYVDLAALFSEAYHKDYAKKWGFEEGIAGWKEYCQKELDIHYRKAMYFIDIHDKIKSLDLNPRDFDKLGWSKVKEIVTVMTTKNAKDWLEKAKKMSVRELTEAVKIVRRKQGKGRDDVPTVTTISFKMDEGQGRIVTDALEEAKGLLDVESGVPALVMICQDWLEAKGVTPQVATLDDHVKFLEKQFGVAMSYKKTGKAKAEKDPEAAAKPAKKDEKAKIVEKAKKKAGKDSKKKADAADDMDDILGSSGGDGDDDEINSALGLDD